MKLDARQRALSERRKERGVRPNSPDLDLDDGLT
jgi:hypothetical protein